MAYIEVGQSTAERPAHLDPQPLVLQSGGVLIGSPSMIEGTLPWSFGCGPDMVRVYSIMCFDGETVVYLDNPKVNASKES